jgi:hypothetical protein
MIFAFFILVSSHYFSDVVMNNQYNNMYYNGVLRIVAKFQKQPSSQVQ